jgi:hypothetical protein
LPFSARKAYLKQTPAVAGWNNDADKAFDSSPEVFVDKGVLSLQNGASKVE